MKYLVKLLGIVSIPVFVPFLAILHLLTFISYVFRIKKLYMISSLAYAWIGWHISVILVDEYAVTKAWIEVRDEIEGSLKYVMNKKFKN